MMDMMGGMGVMMLIGLLLLAIVIGVAVYLGVRATQTRSGPTRPMERELAALCALAALGALRIDVRCSAAAERMALT